MTVLACDPSGGVLHHLVGMWYSLVICRSISVAAPVAGTNAHVIMQSSDSTALCAPGQGSLTETHSRLSWKLNRHWLAPQPHLLLSQFLKLSGTAVLMQCQLHKPNLAMLLDHQVQGRALFPAAAFLELAHGMQLKHTF